MDHVTLTPQALAFQRVPIVGLHCLAGARALVRGTCATLCQSYLLYFRPWQGLVFASAPSLDCEHTTPSQPDCKSAVNSSTIAMRHLLPAL